MNNNSLSIVSSRAFSSSPFNNECFSGRDLEPPKRLESNSKVNRVCKKLFTMTKMIGKGLREIERQNGTGRYIGQGHGEQPYWIKEFVYKNSPLVGQEIDTYINGWRQDKNSPLSLKEWVSSKHEEWIELNIKQEFLSWIATNTWNSEEKEAWNKANPEDIFTEDKLQSWSESQRDPELATPIWKLKRQASDDGKDNDIDFPVWRNRELGWCREDWEKFKEETGAVDCSFKDFEQLHFAYSCSGAVDDQTRWTLKQLWHKSQIRDANVPEDFSIFVQELKWRQETNSGKTMDSLAVWNDKQKQVDYKRYQGSHLPLSYEKYQLQQDCGPLIESTPFNSLGEADRRIYLITCHSGVLLRNGFPFDTSFEKTLFSGNGYAIFVIGSDESMYAGTHIVNVFHHSSFLGGSAVRTAGEMKTLPNGTVVELSNKSGHYRPVIAQNRYMLMYFKNRGVDLSKIIFEHRTDEGSKKINSQEYLDNC